MPKYGVILWSKPLAQIPAGWVVCDGNNGTIDMRGFFPKGADAGQAGGGNGGSATHTHSIAGLSTSANTSGAFDANSGGSYALASLSHNHNVTGSLGTASSEPQYKTWVFIMKI